MDTAVQSTIRKLSIILAIAGSAICISACSAQSKNDWFHWGKDEPKEPEQTVDLGGVDHGIDHAESDPEEPEPEPQHIETEPAQTPVVSQPAVIEEAAQDSSDHADASKQSVDEIVQLYRRLHVEMAQESRSELVVELLNDHRERVRLLGFELASRDLSSGATLSAPAANAATALLSDPLPSIRQGSARLITRLALPDAMTLLTGALATEHDPNVSETLLRGIERWPNTDARADVLRWYQSTGTVRIAASNAAWGIADLNLWDLETHGSDLRAVYRELDNTELTPSDMRLIAVTGESSDLDRLVVLVRDPEFASRAQAASALVQTPRGVDTLIAMAMDDPQFSPAAADAIQRHRLNPNGVRRLASLPWNDEQTRVDTLVRICGKLDRDQLSDAIGLARTDQTVDDALTIRLLSPLVTGVQNISPRSASGVILLAELELNNQRPDRALEILSLLPESGIDPSDSLRASKASASSHIMLLEFDEAWAIDQTAETWLSALALPSDQSSKVQIAQEIRSRGITLNPDQQTVVDLIIERGLEQPEPEASDTPSDTNSGTTSDTPTGAPSEQP